MRASQNLRVHSLRNAPFLSAVLALLVGGLCGCAEPRVAPTDIQAVSDAVQILLYRPSDMALGASTAVIAIDGVEVASLGRSDHKVVTLSPGIKEMTVSGGWRSGENTVRFEAKQGQVYRFAIRLRAQTGKTVGFGGPSLQVLKDDGTFSFYKL